MHGRDGFLLAEYIALNTSARRNQHECDGGVCGRRQNSMTLDAIKEWLIPASGTLGIIVVVFQIVNYLKDWRLKLQAETGAFSRNRDTDQVAKALYRNHDGCPCTRR